jgi:RimJ/RimL family protein N-acetyltransferase
MIFPEKYIAVEKPFYELGDVKIVPIRFEDREPIRTWRNEQIKYLRQIKELSENEQEDYFRSVVYPLFNQKEPKQILWSILRSEDLIGYGGLVHIDWESRNAEISFLLKPELNYGESYHLLFEKYLQMIELVAKDIKLHKIYSYGYVIEQFRFEPLIKQNFRLEAKLKKHKRIENAFHSVLIYSKIIKNGND